MSFLFLSDSRSYPTLVGFYAKEIQTLSTYNDFQTWLSPGLDRLLNNGKYWRCASSCDMQNEGMKERGETCMNWASLTSMFFYDNEGIPTPAFRNCLTRNLKYTLMQEFMSSTDFDTYNQFFNEIEKAGVDVIKTQVVVDKPAFEIDYTLIEVITGVRVDIEGQQIIYSGNNQCFQAEIGRQVGEHRKNLLHFETEADKNSYDTCHPCYLQCMANRESVSDFRDLDELNQWMHPEEDDMCASTCSPSCLGWKGILKLFFGQPDSEVFKPKIPFKACLTKEVDPDLMNQAASSTTFYLTYFTDNNDCLKKEFNYMIPRIDHTDTYHLCKPCYTRCIAEAPDLNKLNYFENLTQWMESPRECHILGKPCSSDCKNFPGLIKDYFFEPTLGGHGEEQPNKYLKSCLANNMNEDFENEIMKESKKVRDKWLGDNIKNHNPCLQHQLAGLSDWQHDPVFYRCRSCYLNCLSEKVDDINTIEEYEDLMEWVQKAGDTVNREGRVILSCVNQCNPPNMLSDDENRCLYWGEMIDKYFYEDRVHNHDTPDSNHRFPNEAFKVCLRDNTKSVLKNNVRQYEGESTYLNYFDMAVHYFNEQLEQEDATGGKIYGDFSGLKLEGANHCLQKIMYNIEETDLITDDQKNLFDICKPCYMECLKDAPDMSALKNLSDLIDWFAGGDSRICASRCHNRCYKFDEMLILYFNKPNAVGFEPHPAFRRCLTFGADPNLIEMARKSTSFYMTYFIDQNSCLLHEFKHVSMFDDFEPLNGVPENFNTCLPCYTRCIAEADDLSLIKTEEELNRWLNSVRLCKYMDSPCAEDCYTWDQMIKEFFFEINDLSKEVVPSSHFQTCMRDENPELRPVLEENNFELGEKFYGKHLKDHNHCLQDLISRVSNGDAKHERCKPCYIHCLAEEALSLNDLTTYDEFNMWISPGPDHFDPVTGNIDYKCSRDCDLEDDSPDAKCFNFEQFIEYYFFETIGDVTSPSKYFRMCLKMETSEELQEDIHKKEEFHLDLWHGLINHDNSQLVDYVITDVADERYTCYSSHVMHKHGLPSSLTDYNPNLYKCLIGDTRRYCHLQVDGGAGMCNLFKNCFFGGNILCPQTCERMREHFPREMCKSHHPHQEMCDWWRNDEENMEVCYKRGGKFSSEPEKCVPVDNFIDQYDLDFDCNPAIMETEVESNIINVIETAVNPAVPSPPVPGPTFFPPLSVVTGANNITPPLPSLPVPSPTIVPPMPVVTGSNNVTPPLPSLPVAGPTIMPPMPGPTGSNIVTLSPATEAPSPGSPSPGSPSPGSPNPGTPNPGTPNPGTPNPGSPSPGSASPGTPGTPNPGSPSPGTPGSPSPGTPGSPSPGTPGSPSPGTPGEPGTPGSPSPGTPGTPGTPNPGTPGTPDPNVDYGEPWSPSNDYDFMDEPDERYRCSDTRSEPNYDHYQCALRDDVRFCSKQVSGGSGLCSLFRTCFFKLPHEKIWCPHTCDKLRRQFPRELCREHHPNEKLCNWWRNDEVNMQVCYKRGGWLSTIEEVCTPVESFVESEGLICEGLVTTTKAPVTKPVITTTPKPVCQEAEPFDYECQANTLLKDDSNYCRAVSKKGFCMLFRLCYLDNKVKCPLTCAAMKKTFPREACKWHNRSKIQCTQWRNDEANSQVCYRKTPTQPEQCIEVESFVDQSDLC